MNNTANKIVYTSNIIQTVYTYNKLDICLIRQ